MDDDDFFYFLVNNDYESLVGSMFGNLRKWAHNWKRMQSGAPEYFAKIERLLTLAGDTMMVAVIQDTQQEIYDRLEFFEGAFNRHMALCGCVPGWREDDIPAQPWGNPTPGALSHIMMMLGQVYCVAEREELWLGRDEAAIRARAEEEYDWLDEEEDDEDD